MELADRYETYELKKKNMVSNTSILGTLFPFLKKMQKKKHWKKQKTQGVLLDMV